MASQATPTPQRRFDNPAVFICDIQEAFRPTISSFPSLLLTTKKLIRAATALTIPIYITTQNRARLGPTVPELTSLIPSPPGPAVDIDKTRFSMYIPPISTSHFPPFSPSTKKAQIAIVGIEAHICVTQTALDLIGAGHEVYIIADGVSSSNAEEVPVALARLRAAGAVVTTSESWVYECMGDAGIAEFRSIVKLVKETAGDTKASLQALLGTGPASKM
ncbi:hypothetical protein QBC47DRAFT_73291 [Echria macrotheca]|uniref:Isochorismatase-like domain-containing protein n=1 Tax=Echria macrotheca TaxID=438768 RepID=A0AAJ0F2Z1_9PEZI|nr:hypothetical protein QBC47DRAFT_73291 [Echria macrotheca]